MRQTLQLPFCAPLGELVLDPFNEINQDPSGLVQVLLTVPGSYGCVSTTVWVHIHLYIGGSHVAYHNHRKLVTLCLLSFIYSNKIKRFAIWSPVHSETKGFMLKYIEFDMFSKMLVQPIHAALLPASVQSHYNCPPTQGGSC